MSKRLDSILTTFWVSYNKGSGVYHVLHIFLATLLRWIYRVEVHGIEHFKSAGPRVLIVANHTSFLDALLLSLFLPDRLTFAIDTHHAQRWYGRLAHLFVDLFPMNPLINCRAFRGHGVAGKD